jgi:hypothetical protein
MQLPQPSDRDVDRVRRAQRLAVRDARPGRRTDQVVRGGGRARARRGTLGAVAVGLAATAIVVAPHLIDGSPVTNSAGDPAAPPSASASGSAISPYANPCPDAPVPVSDRSASRIVLPPDVAMVRLCRAQGSGVSSPWQPPQDALVRQVDAFAASVERLPTAPVDPCPAARVAPQPFALQLTDSDGRTTTLSSMLTTCGSVAVNSRRVAADRLLDVFRQLLVRQRDSVPPQPPVTTLTCRSEAPPIPPGWLQHVTADTRFIAVASCPLRGAAFDPASTTALQRLNQAWAEGASGPRGDEQPNAEHCLDRATADTLLRPYVMTAAGDVVPMRRVVCGIYRIGRFQFAARAQLRNALSLP